MPGCQNLIPPSCPGWPLRGGFSHLIAALAAEGTSRVRGIGLIDRGYEHFQAKLDALGAMYERD